MNDQPQQDFYQPDGYLPDDNTSSQNGNEYLDIYQFISSPGFQKNYDKFFRGYTPDDNSNSRLSNQKYDVNNYLT